MRPTDTSTRPPTWQTLTSAEPRLPAVMAAARRIRRPTWRDYTAAKNRLSTLVGWDAPASAHPLLRTAEAYALCIDRLLTALRL